MNAMLASGGYPWTVIRIEERDAYMKALESASVENDIGPFADFIARKLGRRCEFDETPSAGPKI